MKLFEHFLYVKYNLQVHFFKNRIKVQKKAVLMHFPFARILNYLQLKKRCKRRKNAFLDTIKGVNFAYPLYPSRENKDILSFFTLPVLCYSSKGKQVNEYILLLASFFSFLGFLGFVYTKKRLEINASRCIWKGNVYTYRAKGRLFYFCKHFPFVDALKHCHIKPFLCLRQPIFLETIMVSNILHDFRL